MADAEKPDAPVPEETQGQGKSKRKLLIVAILAVALLGGGGATAFVFLRGGEAGPEEGQEQEAPKARAAVLPLDAFILNLAGPDASHYLKCTLRIIVTRSEVAERVKGDEVLLVQVRDRVLTLLTSKTMAEVTTPLGKEALRSQIALELDQLLGEGSVSDVLFSEFVVQ